MSGGGEAPLWVLRPSTLAHLSAQLCCERLLPTEEGRLADWRGVAEEAGVAMKPAYLRIQAAQEPFKELFKELRSTMTVQQFWGVLETVDRWDVLDDCMARMVEDIRVAEVQAQAKGIDLARLPAIEVERREEALTMEDLARLARDQPLVTYDCMVLYSEAEAVFAEEVLVPNLEAQGLQVLVRDRDLLGGAFEHQAMLRLISERCSKLVPVFSQGFFDHDGQNSFLTTFAQHCGLEEGRKKLVPLVVGQTSIPSNLSMYHKLPYDPSNSKHKWFWEKLVKTIHPRGEFDPSIPMKDLGAPAPPLARTQCTVSQWDPSNHVPAPSAPKISKENTPEKPPATKMPVVKSKPATPQKETPKVKTKPKFKIPSPFGRKSEKSKRSAEATEATFRDLCSADSPAEVEEEGVNESGELLLPAVPSHEPGVVDRVLGRVARAATRAARSAQAESIA